jgi:hypothetical protein
MVCCWAAKHAKRLEGDFVECGVNTGILSLAACNYIDFNSTGKRFYLFDTFCGIPEHQVQGDETKHVQKTNASYYEECYDVAKRNFKPFPGAVFVRGCIPETLTVERIEKVSYLSIDMNIMEPEIAAIEFFWDKLVTGAPVVLDDYGFKPHRRQKDAFDAFAKRKGVEILTLPTGQGLLLKS